jgi:Flp pilus assembly protein TadD
MGRRAKPPQAGRTGARPVAAKPPADPPPGVLRELVTLYRQSRHRELLATATQQQIRHPRSLTLYSLIAGAHTGLGNPGAAITCLDRALTLWPGSAELHYNKGVILGGTGAHDAAQRCYEEALRLDPSHAGAANNLGSVLREKGDFAAARPARRCSVS